jgi:hypothetical protein
MPEYFIGSVRLTRIYVPFTAQFNRIHLFSLTAHFGLNRFWFILVNLLKNSIFPQTVNKSKTSYTSEYYPVHAYGSKAKKSVQPV